MVQNILKAVLMGGVIAMLGTSTQVVRASEPGENSGGRQGPIKMSFSGSSIPTSIAVQPDTITDEEILAGNGSLGPFTFRKLRTDNIQPASFGVCGTGVGPNLLIPTGAGVFRFEDGSLLTVSVTQGELCIDLDHLLGHLTETYEITGGTGRLKNASGTLHVIGTLQPVMFSSTGAAVLLTNSGDINGAIRVP